VGLPVQFALDTTAPTVVITGVSANTAYEAESQTAVIDARDNVALERVDVYEGDATTPTETYTAEWIAAQGGTIDYVLEESLGAQSLRVIATDMAGNKSAEVTVADIVIGVTPISAIPAMPSTSIWVIVGILAAAVVVFIVAFAIAKRRRMNENKPRHVADSGVL
jgi:hypothetical protein